MNTENQEIDKDLDNEGQGQDNTNATESDETNYLEMSDDELMAAPAPDFVTSNVSDYGTTDAADEDDTGTGSVDADPADVDENSEDVTAEDPGTGSKAGAADLVDKAPKDEKTPSVADTTKAPEVPVDYAAEYTRLLAPFKANGKDIQVKDVDEAIALMQMGAGYNKKMAALKPNLKLMKMLQNNNLLDESKLSFLIDLEKGNPDALNKLLKDRNVDPLDLDAEKASSYKESNHTVRDEAVELDMVLDEIEHTPTFNQTAAFVQKLDPASQDVIAKQPIMVKWLHSHIESGVAALIQDQIERERTFGRLSGLSDLEAYRQVGDAIQARGGFDHLVQPRMNPGQQAPTRPAVVVPNPKRVDTGKLNERRKAASPVKPSIPKSAGIQDYNPLSLSDAEFEKMAQPKYL